MIVGRVWGQLAGGWVSKLERHQVVVYLAAIAAGLVVGWLAPHAGPSLEKTINPVLGVLLYVTFLQVPARDLLRSLRGGHFLAAALVVNFVVVPLVVAGLFWLLPADTAVRLGVLLVLLCPCVDYVIVFSGLAGGDSRRLLAATPLLLIAQMLLLPVFLVAFLGSGLSSVENGPFIEAFVFLILVPLALAWLSQWWARRKPLGRRVSDGMTAAMVPLMALTLLVVVASQVPKLGGQFADIAAVVPVYVLFLVVMAVAGLMVARLFRLDVAAGRAVIFTGATRNSLVVLPVALALPSNLAVAAVVVVTQALVEVLGMVAYMKVVPRLLPDPLGPGSRSG